MKYQPVIQLGFLSLLLTGCNHSATQSEETEDKVDLTSAYQIHSVMLPEKPKTASQTSSTNRYGVKTPVDFYLNDDGTLDVFWIDEGDTSTRWNITKHLSFHDPIITENITIPSSVNQSGQFLGFGKNESSEHYFLAYTKDNQYAVRDNGECVPINNSKENCDGEYWISGFESSGQSIFDTSLFGNIDLTLSDIYGSETKGNPGAASVGIVAYHEAEDSILLYTGHRQRWSDGKRHQAGWIGRVSGSGEFEQAINGWYSSHNFDQRLMLSSDGSVLSLAHGDAYPRALMLSKWDMESNKADFNYNYYTIQNGTTGQNVTLADTGDFAQLDSDRIAIAFSTEDSRESRDVRLQVLSGLQSSDITLEEDIWVTKNNSSRTVGKGIKVVKANDGQILIAWNTYQGSNSDEGTSYGNYVDTTLALYNEQGSRLGSITISDQLMPTQSLKLTPDGQNAIWVTTSTDGELMVHSVDLQSLAQ
ncbi:hypothetical protein ACWONS_004715 [Vibrio parahaemolyticus]